MKELHFNSEIFKILLSAPMKDTDYTRIEIIINGDIAQASMYTQKQNFHKNMPIDEVLTFVNEHLGTNFSQYTAWDGKREYSARVTKKGKLLTNSKAAIVAAPKLAVGSFNKQKSHILQEGDHIPVLVDMGIFTKEGKIAANMYDKFQQINRFLELIDDATKNIASDINIIDFGCGKSYLTFLVYHYFANRGIQANICGLDLNETVIQNCRRAAEKYNYSSLAFMLGDIGNQNAPPLAKWGAADSFNMVISLHACDTATDHAIFNAVKWEADLILAAPCCQHELRKQMKPSTFDIFSSYGIIEERMAALATDAIRAKLLESVGYKTQIIEFAPLENTAKNLLIRASRARRGKANPNALESVKVLMNEFAFQPTLFTLLKQI